jgi:hypothetical protein
MTPGETVRFACGDCGIVFDLGVAPVSEWAEEIDEADFDGPLEAGEPGVCPFCGAAELKPTHDRAAHRA